ncbi:MAG TPA: Rne/Rng family ribonuclease [Polyangiaceae bacterium]|jgi:ribonuclease G
MARNILVINCDLRETRVALIENGVIAELQIERANAQNTVGNIVLGKVTRVLPGMQAAFIDVGLEHAAFLHVEDLIRPEDFEAYLARGDDEETWGGADGHRAEGSTNAPARKELGGAESTAESATGSEAVVPIAVADDEAEEGAGALEPEETDESEVAGGAVEEEPSNPPAAGRARRTRRRQKPSSSVDPKASQPLVARRASVPKRGRQDARFRNQHSDATGRARAMRAARAVPITEVVREGDDVIVQISKEPISTKGARVTSHVSLPGRYVVYLPTVDHVGISRRIGSSAERVRLRKVVESLKPQSGGLIVRTLGAGLTKKALKADIGYLIKLWAEVSRKRESAKAPTVLYTELDLVLKTARDLFTDEIERIVIDDREKWGRLVRFVEMFLPQRAKDIEYYSGDEPIFDAYGLEDEIGRALSRKVPLASGGYLIIDQAEALTAIDVNTGRYVGKGSKDLEETALKTNLEAVDEIAYQLRFRNIGGLVILDLIDMDLPGNRDKVWRALEQQLSKDKAKTTLNRISELGLIEMTRKRTRESLSRTMNEPCFYCDGTGQIQSKRTIAYEILRQIRRERESLPGYSVVVNAHPAVVDLMTGEEKEAVAQAERRYMRRIEFNAHREYHIEQFDLQGK